MRFSPGAGTLDMELTRHVDKRYSDNRKLSRYQIDYDSIPIIDLAAGSILGQVENIALGGILLKSDQATPPGQVFRISMSMPGQISEKYTFRCSIRSLWSCPSENLWDEKKQAPQHFWNGYEFLYLTPQGIETIEAMIAIFGQASNSRFE